MQKIDFELTLTFENDKLSFIDQTLLPLTEKRLVLTDYKKLIEAIKMLRIRGAPAIGVAGAYGVVLAAIQFQKKYLNNYPKFIKQLLVASDEIANARPTAINLSWAVQRMKRLLQSTSLNSSKEVVDFLKAEAKFILQEDLKIGMELGLKGSAMIKDGDAILTHCNAGGLATAGMGSALSIFYYAKKAGKKFIVYVDETRPLLQGARLTTYELAKWGIDHILICDNMAASLMKQKIITKVLTGADRIARNGDSANKIGTYGVAALANFHKIPFYIAAPYSTFDPTANSEKDIPIELRNSDEIRFIKHTQIAPHSSTVYNPAFDVVPAKLITAIISEKGFLKNPNKVNIQKFFNDVKPSLNSSTRKLKKLSK